MRSERSLVQTIGRAARHIHGKAILYADKETNSMQRAIGETERRRLRQSAYNEKMGIVPQGIIKAVSDSSLEGGRKKEDAQDRRKKKQSLAQELTPEILTARDHLRRIRNLEDKMKSCSKNLEFEKAAGFRDALRKARELFKLSEV